MLPAYFQLRAASWLWPLSFNVRFSLVTGPSAQAIEEIFLGVVAALLFAPSPLRLAVLWLQVHRGAEVQFRRHFRLGIKIHLVNSLLSPCLPALIAYQDYKCGPGCLGSLISLFLLPVIWTLFFLGNWQINKGWKKQDIGQAQQAQEAQEAPKWVEDLGIRVLPDPSAKTGFSKETDEK